jgi:hypothetical protein
MKELRMLPLGVALLVVSLMLGQSGIVGASKSCTVADLNGTYLFRANGFTTPSGGSAPTAPKTIVEVEHFNGDGTVDVARATRSVNGVLFEENAGDPGTSGTYTVNSTPSDGVCTGTLSFGSLPNFDIYFVESRPEEVTKIQTDAGNVFQGTAMKVSH